MNIISHVLEFLKDPKIKNRNKISTFLIIIVVCISANNYFGLSYYFKNNLKISQFNDINETLKDSTISDLNRTKLAALQNEIINRDHFTNDLIFYFQTKDGYINKRENPLYKEVILTDLMFIYSNFGVYLFLAASIIFMAVYQQFKDEVNPKIMLYMLGFALLVLIFGSFSTSVINLLIPNGFIYINALDCLFYVIINLTITHLILYFLGVYNPKKNMINYDKISDLAISNQVSKKEEGDKN